MPKVLERFHYAPCSSLLNSLKDIFTKLQSDINKIQLGTNKFDFFLKILYPYFLHSNKGGYYFFNAVSFSSNFLAEEEANGEASACGKILIFLSWLLVIVTMPFSLLVCFKVRPIC